MKIIHKISKPKIEAEKVVMEVPIDTIIPWKGNPRKNDDAAKRLAKILKVHGQVTPVVVWRKNNVIYKGNTTLKAMKLLKYDKIRVVYVDFPSETAAIAYALDDNKSSEFAKWDDDVLRNLMQVQNLEVKGFSANELKLLELGEELPDRLPDVKIVGDGEESIDNYIIITFDSRESFDSFVKRMGAKGSKKTFTEQDLLSMMQWKGTPPKIRILRRKK